MQSNQQQSGSEFAGKVVVVTGGARGIGRAIAEHFRCNGARLILVDRNAEQGAEAVKAMSKSGHPAVELILADLGDPDGIVKVAEAVQELTPHVDVLINNAGIELDLPFTEVKVQDFDRVIAVNLRAPFLLTQALVPLFPASGGAIINMSSIHAEHAFANSIPYACSKAALLALTRNLALELASRNIRVNAVCPGYIDTPLWDEWIKSSQDPEALAKQTADLHPLGRRGLPKDVAGAVSYLTSGAAMWVTGTHIVVDGGLTIRAHP